MPADMHLLSHLVLVVAFLEFVDVAKHAGLTAPNVAGEEAHKKYILEMNGSGVAFFDYNNDGFPDLFVVNGTRWNIPPGGAPPTNHLYRNNGDGTFREVAGPAGLAGSEGHWHSGCAFVDYDRDGRLDLFVASYIDPGLNFANVPVPGSGEYCEYKGLPIACGPRGLKAGVNYLFHNKGDGTFEDSSEA